MKGVDMSDPIAVDPVLLRDIRIAYLNHKLAEQQVVAILQQTRQVLDAAFVAAGLVPGQAYSFD